MIEHRKIEEKLDGERFALYINSLNPSDLSARELLDHIVILEYILCSNETINIMNRSSSRKRPLTPDSEVYLMVAKSSIQRFYDEFDRRNY